MLFIIHVHDRAGRSADRAAHYEAHKAYIADTSKWGVRIVMSGPLVADDGATPIGSHFVLEAPDRVAVEAFHRADPFFAAGIWDKADIAAFIKRYG
jgi:uncharacterized protein YciI